LAFAIVEGETNSFNYYENM